MFQTDINYQINVAMDAVFQVLSTSFVYPTAALQASAMKPI